MQVIFTQNIWSLLLKFMYKHLYEQNNPSRKYFSLSYRGEIKLSSNFPKTFMHNFSF